MLSDIYSSYRVHKMAGETFFSPVSHALTESLKVSIVSLFKKEIDIRSA